MPQSIGGTNEERNIVIVETKQHALYHLLFNNYHPSTVIRVCLFIILPSIFNVPLAKLNNNKEIEEFLENFDNGITKNNLFGSKKGKIREKEEKIKALIEFDKIASRSQKSLFKKEFKEILNSFTCYHKLSYSPESFLTELSLFFPFMDFSKLIRSVSS